MNQQPRPDFDLNELYETEYERWRTSQSARVPMAVRLATVVRWSILVVAVAAFGLSAAHTISVFNVISPGVAWLAPVMIEVGLAYAALRIKLDAIRSEKPTRALIILVMLLVVAAFASNLAGGLTAAVVSAGITDLSGEAIGRAFGSFPLVVQAGLFGAVLMAFIVPAASIVAGEGVASLLFDTQRNDMDGAEYLDQRWREVAYERLYRKVYVRLNGRGLPPNEAAKLAQREVKGYLAPGPTMDKQEKQEQRADSGSPVRPENVGMTVLTPEPKRRNPKSAEAQLNEMYAAFSGNLPSASEIIRQSGLPKSTVYDWLKKRSKE